MITQKEALKNLTEFLPHDYRLLFVYNWLEDINWHSEAAMLAEVAFHNPAKMDWLELMRVIFNPAGYNRQYVEEKAALIPEANKMRLDDILKDGRYYMPESGAVIDREDILNYMKAENYSPFSYIFGWGIDSKDWESSGTGRPFVDELLKDIINK